MRLLRVACPHVGVTERRLEICADRLDGSDYRNATFSNASRRIPLYSGTAARSPGFILIESAIRRCSHRIALFSRVF